eukprot:13481166-Alexandrium_andersonii.AAC.1
MVLCQAAWGDKSRKGRLDRFASSKQQGLLAPGATDRPSCLWNQSKSPKILYTMPNKPFELKGSPLCRSPKLPGSQGTPPKSVAGCSPW